MKMSLIPSVLLVLMVCFAVPAVAQTPKKGQGLTIIRPEQRPVQKGVKLTGTLKGNATGTRFNLVSGGKTYQVDTFGGVCRYKGKRYDASKLKSGDSVTVVGKFAGKLFKASDILVASLKPTKKKH